MGSSLAEMTVFCGVVGDAGGGLQIFSVIPLLLLASVYTTTAGLLEALAPLNSAAQVAGLVGGGGGGTPAAGVEVSLKRQGKLALTHWAQRTNYLSLSLSLPNSSTLCHPSNKILKTYLFQKHFDNL